MKDDAKKASSKESAASNGKTAPQQPPSTPPTFGKSALVMLVVSVVLYAYQTNLFDRFFEAAPLPEDPEPAFRFPQPVSSADKVKRDAVVEAFKHAWSGYEKNAMGNDEYHPLSKTGSNFSKEGGIGYGVIDAMDTMYIMGLKDEFKRARKWLAEEQTFDRSANFNTFETTIRVLGGLLSSYNLSKDKLFLDKAVDLANRLLPAFETPSGLPLPMVDLKTRKGVADEYNANVISTAEATTLQLELRYLSHLTDNDDYWDKAEDVMKVIRSAQIPLRLVPIYMDASTGKFSVSEIRLGSRGDSYYEYLLKQYLQTDKSERGFLDMYNEAMDAIHSKLLQKAIQFNHTYTAELIPQTKSNGQTDWKLKNKQDHLVCFLGGNLMLGAAKTGAVQPKVSKPPRSTELTATAVRDFKTGLELIKTCLHTHQTLTGLPPEIAHFYDDSFKRKWKNKERDFYIDGNDAPGIPSYDARYLLRPETVESLFIAHRLTGDPQYREAGWKIFESIEKYAKIEGGYASILDVDAPHTIRMDKMETFFLSETLKYLYLLFSDSKTISLDDYVFNTEAHPLPIFNPSRRTAFS